MLPRRLFAVLAFACAQAQAQPAMVDLDTPFVTTPDAVVRAMLDLARLVPGERLIDLGSGDGRIVIEAALRGAVAHGAEIDSRLVARSRDAAMRAGVAERATFATQDLFDTDFAHADVVTMYLLPDVNARLAPKLYATLAPGARVVSHDYGLGDWPADATREVDAPGKTVGVVKRSTLMLWTVPAKLAGRWQGDVGAAPLRIVLAQSWQHVTGTLRWRGQEYGFAGQRVDARVLRLVAAAGDGTKLGLRLDVHGDETLSGMLRAGDGPELPVRLRRDP